jgi:hypothetical protein
MGGKKIMMIKELLDVTFYDKEGSLIDIIDLTDYITTDTSIPYASGGNGSRFIAKMKDDLDMEQNNNNKEEC